MLLQDALPLWHAIEQCGRSLKVPAQAAPIESNSVVFVRTMISQTDFIGILPSYGSPADFVDNLKRGFDQLWEEGETHPRMMSIGLHPRLIGQASRIHALREFLEHAQQNGKVWFARRIDIANWWNEQQVEFGR